MHLESSTSNIAGHLYSHFCYLIEMKLKMGDCRYETLKYDFVQA